MLKIEVLKKSLRKEFLKIEVFKRWSLQKSKSLKFKSSKIEEFLNWSLQQLKSSKIEIFKIQSLQKLKA